MVQDIIVFGQDSRMSYVAEYFYNLGFDVYESLQIVNKHVCAIIAPTLSHEEELELSNFTGEDILVFYGRLSETCLLSLKSHGITCISYLNIEKFVSENAILTANGIVKIATKANACLVESHCLVLGYGHCGKAIAEKLKQLGVKVSVMVRRKDQKSSIEADGYEYLNLTISERYCYEKFSYIFNTIPAFVLSKEVISRMPSNIMIFDIASKPGGTDFDFCKTNGIIADLYLGIPGKMYPREAGELIADCVYEKIHTTESLTQE